jgi:hypothetical protein
MRRVTMPVKRPAHGDVPIDQIRIDDSRPWRDDIRKTIAQSYARAAHFDEVFPVIGDLLAHEEDSVAAFNKHAIRTLCRLLALDADKIVSSSTFHVNETATDRLIALVRRAGGGIYLCGGGADGYQEDEKFEAAGIELRFQAFRHPAYPQCGRGEFVAGLSILDALLNLGSAETARLLGKGA